MTFPRSIAPEAGIGPESNTGQKTSQLAAPIIDWCAVTFPKGTLKALGLSDYHQLLAFVFGTAGKVALGEIQQKVWNFFPWSGVMTDETNSLAGRIGLNDKGETHISLTGQGCKHVQDWHHVAECIEKVGGRLTRVDIAVDDFAGQQVNIEAFRAHVAAGDFTSNGRPPLCQFVDDCGSNKGCTLYIGQRGYKQLCVYEKGKQLGDPESPYTRCELRLYNKHHVIEPSVLHDPKPFFKGAYECLALYIDGELEKLEAKERQTDPSARAMFKNLHRQCGRDFGLLIQAFGEEAVVEVIKQRIAREGRPRRFKSYVGDLPSYLRTHHQGTNDEDQDPQRGSD